MLGHIKCGRGKCCLAVERQLQTRMESDYHSSKYTAGRLCY